MPAVQRSTENLASAVDESLGLVCVLCDQEMIYPSGCVTTLCKHTFHRDCITPFLADSHECPKCKQLCHEKDLASMGTRTGTRPKTSSFRGRGRGSGYKQYNTRNAKVQDEVNVTQNTPGEGPRNENEPLPLLNLNSPTKDNNASRNLVNTSHNTTHQSMRGRRGNRNLEQMSRMIESTVQRVLSQMQVSPLPLQPLLQSPLQTPQPNPISSSPPREANSTQSPQIESRPILNSVRMPPDKITTLIQSWHIKFDGSYNGLRCEEFLYRIKCLTEENFNGNFENICRNLHVLLTGKAKEWYWRYRKSVTNVQWESFCSALKYQYKDFRTTFDMREELHNRKQKPTETFEVFYDAIYEIVDRLAVPIDEDELIEIVTRNLRPEIRHELLYVQINSIAQLKKLCQKREKLLSEDYFRRGNFHRNAGNFSQPPQRRVAAIEENIEIEENLNTVDFDKVDSPEFEVNAINHTDRVIKCWNCDEEGHFWDMCIQDRRIFCYGCGTKNVYKPQCIKCANNTRNSKNFQSSYNQRQAPK